MLMLLGVHLQECNWDLLSKLKKYSCDNHIIHEEKDWSKIVLLKADISFL